MLQLPALIDVAMHSVNGSNKQQGAFGRTSCAYARHAGEQTGLEPRACLQASGRRYAASG